MYWDVKPIAYPYFRSILRDARNIKDIPISVEHDVLEVAQIALNDNKVNDVQYNAVVNPTDKFVVEG